MNDNVCDLIISPTFSFDEFFEHSLSNGKKIFVIIFKYMYEKLPLKIDIDL